MTIDLAVRWEEQTPVPLARWLGAGMANPRSWSPDGEKIAGYITGGGIFVYSFANEDYVLLKDHGGFPTWLADSRRLVFASPLSPDTGKLYLVDSETGETRELLASQRGALQFPFVSHDGRFLFFILRTLEADVWLAELETRQ